MKALAKLLAQVGVRDDLSGRSGRGPQHRAGLERSRMTESEKAWLAKFPKDIADCIARCGRPMPPRDVAISHFVRPEPLDSSAVALADRAFEDYRKVEALLNLSHPTRRF